MHNRILQVLLLLIVTGCFYMPVAAQKQLTRKESDRTLWLAYLDKLARPVLSNLAEDKLKLQMPVALSPKVDNREVRTKVAYLEAFGRTLSGIGPWLNSEAGSNEEIALRNQYRRWAVQALANAVNPAAKDYMQWTGGQPLVDASFLALGLVRCPWLWEHTDSAVKRQVTEAFRLTRSTVPVYSNWLLFSAMIEAFFCHYGLDYDPVRIEFAVREFSEHWYTGDGLFADGNKFHFDYYNSIVIHPYLATIVGILNKKRGAYNAFVPKLEQINKRYAEIQELLINADGTFPATGRSITYRGGVFHHLADMGLRKQLPASLQPAQVRGALTAVLEKTLGAPGTFLPQGGWLQIGLHGHQPGLGEGYINTGSLYPCTNLLLPLGLPASDPFWAAPAAPWSAVKIWSGQDMAADHALDLQ